MVLKCFNLPSSPLSKEVVLWGDSNLCCQDTSSPVQ
uniref:Uncharacterized protein n=1 Tax=Trichinella nativa TaxID=6335 RepID=A0A0V1KHL0_9BILA